MEVINTNNNCVTVLYVCVCMYVFACVCICVCVCVCVCACVCTYACIITFEMESIHVSHNKPVKLLYSTLINIPPC